jgi:hypothetical protein
MIDDELVEVSEDNVIIQPIVDDPDPRLKADTGLENIYWFIFSEPVPILEQPKNIVINATDPGPLEFLLFFFLRIFLKNREYEAKHKAELEEKQREVDKLLNEAIQKANEDLEKAKGERAKLIETNQKKNRYFLFL